MKTENPVAKHRRDKFALETVFALIEGKPTVHLVVPSLYYSMVAADGTFRIRNIPAGKFTLIFWRDGMPSFSREVIVSDGGKPVTPQVSWPTTPLRK
jgi:hypothetical protein